MNKDLDLKYLGSEFKTTFRQLGKYVGLLFFMLVACVYAFILLRINALANTSAVSDAESTSAVQKLHVDKDVVEQLKKLQDNSVNVQSLFDDARNNPFQE